MASIRRKIEPDLSTPRYIFTETGVGYRMADGEETAQTEKKTIPENRESSFFSPE